MFIVGIKKSFNRIDPFAGMWDKVTVGTGAKEDDFAFNQPVGPGLSAKDR